MATTINTLYDDNLSTVLGSSVTEYDFSTMTHLASKSIYALVDAATSQTTDLELIASKSVEITSLGGNVHASFASGSALKVESAGDGVILRNALEPSGTVTVIDTDVSGRELRVTGTDVMATTHVSGLTVRKNLDFAIVSTDETEGILMNDISTFTSNVSIAGLLDVDGNARMRSNLAVDGNVFGSTMNVYRDNIVQAALESSRVGFGFRVTDKHQLELVRYSEIDSASPVTKRVAVFGNNPVTADEQSNTNYLVFDELSGMVTVGGSDGASPAQTLTWRISDTTGCLYTQSPLIGIGTDDPEFMLDIRGSLGASKITSGEITTTSDARLKDIDNIPMRTSEECLKAIQDVELITYSFKNDEQGRKRTGFRAQQIRDVMPDAVTTNNAFGLEDCHLIDNSVVLAYLVGAVQRLSRVVA